MCMRWCVYVLRAFQNPKAALREQAFDKHHQLLKCFFRSPIENSPIENGHFIKDRLIWRSQRTHTRPRPPTTLTLLKPDFIFCTEFSM